MNEGMQSIPRASGWLPLVGHIWPLWRRPLSFLQELSHLGDVVKADIGTMPVYFLTKPQLIQQVLVGHARKFEKGRLFDRMRPLLGSGLPMAEGELHRRQRRLIQPAFHQARIVEYVAIMQKNAYALAGKWRQGETIAIDSAMHELVISIVAEAMCSAEAGQDLITEVHRSLPTIARGVIVRALAPKILDSLPISLNRSFDTAAHRLRSAIEATILRYQAESVAENDLLSMLLAARDADTGAPMDNAQLRDEMLTILVGGTETTATMLAWSFYELGEHPEIADHLRTEISSVLGSRPIRFTDIAQLPYLERVIREVARLHSLPLLMRRSLQTVELAGFSFPAGTEFALSQYALHRDPRLFPQPELFDPDRWLSSSASARHGSFIPFGMGNRKCIGDAFAWTEMAVVLATILPHWSFTLVPGRSVREVPAAAPRPDSLPMIAHSVNRNAA